MGWVRVAAVLGACTVGLGALGAHGLEERLESAGRVGTWETATFWMAIHVLALLFLVGGSLAVRRWVPFVFVVGILLFSGSLFLLCLTGVTKWGAVTPLGGVAFLAGWIGVAFSKG
ncbi:MAG: DUF423 domain-containing protein [Verrucomicrobiota bacterium]